MVADSLEKDLRKENGGQGSAERKLSLTSHRSSIGTVFLKIAGILNISGDKFQFKVPSRSPSFHLFLGVLLFIHAQIQPHQSLFVM